MGRSRIIDFCVIAGIALLIGVGTGVVVERYTRTQVIDSAFDRMRLFRDLRRAAVEDFMRSISSDVRAMSRNGRIIEAIENFGKSWNETGTEAPQSLRRLYIDENPHALGERALLNDAGDGSRYSKVHAGFHEWARRFLGHFGYYNMFLIDRDGNIVYSAAKEEDFATNLNNGPYSDSPLGRVFQLAVKRGPDRVAVSDFELYAPSQDVPATFIATAIYSKDRELQGVLAIELLAGPINDLLHFTAGMGETGETYLVGNDNLMRSQSRFITQSTLLSQRVDTPSVKSGLAGFNGAQVIDDYRGIPVLSVYSPVDFGGQPWVLLAEIDREEILGQMNLWPILISGLIAGLLAALAAVAVYQFYIWR
jgi:methyl-accepting chemotaxis protein